MPIITNFTVPSASPDTVNPPTRFAFVGRKVSGGSAAFNTPVRIESVTDANTQFGATSELTRWFTYFFSQISSSVEAYGVCYDDSSITTDTARNTAVNSAINSIQNINNFIPDIIIVPIVTRNIDVSTSYANAVATNLNTVCINLQCFAIVDAGKDSSNDQAAAVSWGSANQLTRVAGVFGEFNVAGVTGNTVPASVIIATERGVVDANRGIHIPMDREPVRGITSADSDSVVTYSPVSTSSQVQTLRNARIGTIYQYRSWQVSSPLLYNATANSPVRFITVRRVVDDVVKDLSDVCHDLLGENITGDNVEDTMTTMQQHLEALIGLGEIGGGTVTWGSQNTPTTVQQGFLFFDIAIEVLIPVQRITLNFSVTVASSGLVTTTAP